MKKILFLSLLMVLITSVVVVAKPAPDYFISNYDIMDLDFLRTNYTDINNKRPIQIDGYFKSYHWKSPFIYRERLKAIGFDINNYNVVELELKEKDDFHYSFPILLFHTEAGDLHELESLTPGERVVIYGQFYNLKKSEYAMFVDLIETVQKGGHDRDILIDSRIPFTPTPSPTVTPTPGPNLWQKVNNYINPKETGTPTGTVTPSAKQ